MRQYSNTNPLNEEFVLGELIGMVDGVHGFL